ncbi:unnamed protein product [Meloidogyne enterolobii]|uniref:Uncharacterized protein n=1 Tax=Meloidogyne enterolobii TaxID=390850 RepID=A0ACB1B6K2_MELEN
MSSGVPFPRLNFPISSANAVEGLKITCLFFLKNLLDKSCNCSVNEKLNCDDHEVNQPSKILNLRSRRSQDRN